MSKPFATALLIGLMSRLASAHMIILNPTPFNNETIALDPLHATGANFPCQTNGTANFYNPAGISNPMTIGQPQTLSFRGSASHGGGSCQVAITRDPTPTPSTAWEVILSVEGGCPSVSGEGGSSTYQYTIPEGTDPGNYVLAWTWISHTAGQPEYYMNCAPIQVSAGGSKGNSNSTNFTALAKRNSFPNLAVLNLASVNDCKTTPGEDPLYEDAGPNVLRPSGASRNYAKPTGTNCFPKGAAAAVIPISTSNSAGTGPSIATQSPSGTTNFAAEPSSATSTSTLPSLSFPMVTPISGVSIASSDTLAATSTTAGSSAAEPSPAATSTPLGSPAAVSTPAESPAAASTPESSSSSPLPAPGTGGGSTGLTGACTNEGIWNCIGGNSFQRCASGQWTAVQPMAAGTSCQVGQSTSLWARSRFSRRWSLARRGIL